MFPNSGIVDLYSNAYRLIVLEQCVTPPQMYIQHIFISHAGVTYFNYLHSQNCNFTTDQLRTQNLQIYLLTQNFAIKYNIALNMINII